MTATKAMERSAPWPRWSRAFCALSLAFTACSSRADHEALRPQATPGLPIASAESAPVEAASAPLPASTPRALTAMLDDRPLMRDALDARPALRSWLADRFRGAGQGFPVEWDPSPPQSGQPAEHLQPEGPGLPGVLRIAASHSGVDQLSEAIYELLNMEGGPEFSELWGRAVAHQVTRGAFAEGMTRIELQARSRFKTVAREQSLVPGPRDGMLHSILEAPDDYGEFRRWIAEKHAAGASYDPEEYWAKAYDAIPR